MPLSAAQRSCVLFLSAPQHERTQTIEQFAQVIGVDRRTISRWQKDREFAAALAKGRKAYSESPDYYALCVRQKGLQLLYEGMTKKVGKGKDEITSSERRQYISAVLAETKEVSDSMDVIDRTNLSDAELLAECINRDVGSDLPGFFAACDLLGVSSCSTSLPPSSDADCSPSEDGAESDSVNDEA